MAAVNLERIKAFMTYNGWSEYELAKRMGVSYSYVNRVMSGKRMPGRKFIAGLVDIGMDPKAIFIMPKALPSGNTFLAEQEPTRTTQAG
jgi:transcriptional regulator with XRE-family HTH domain